MTSFVLYYLQHVRHYRLDEFEEYSELMLAIGLILFFGQNYLLTQSKKRQ
jgi:hypothetical protein